MRYIIQNLVAQLDFRSNFDSLNNITPDTPSELRAKLQNIPPLKETEH